MRGFPFVWISASKAAWLAALTTSTGSESKGLMGGDEGRSFGLEPLPLPRPSGDVSHAGVPEAVRECLVDDRPEGRGVATSIVAGGSKDC